MSETYSKAKERLLCELASKGWKVSSGLKIPHATRPDGFRVWFKAQAVYHSHSTNFGDARSMFIETRGVSVDKFIEGADWWSKDHPELLQSTLREREIHSPFIRVGCLCSSKTRAKELKAPARISFGYSSASPARHASCY